MRKQYMLFLFCAGFLGSVCAMENKSLKALSIIRAVSQPLAIASPCHLTIPQLRDDRGYSDEEQLKHAYSPIRYWGHSPEDPNALILLTTAASFGADYLPQADDEWPSC